ncbi:hypothetical protein VCV18_003789 [Metarhizium anisopliae]
MYPCDNKELQKYDRDAPEHPTDEEITNRYNPNGEEAATLSFASLSTTESSAKMDFRKTLRNLELDLMDDNGKAVVAFLREKI